jgi:3-dehydroquinate dehydratase type I
LSKNENEKKVGRGGQGPTAPASSPNPSPPTPDDLFLGPGSRGQGSRLPGPLSAGWEGGLGGGQGTSFPGPSPGSPFRLRLCVPVVAATVNGARSRWLRAARKGLWAEIRLDYLENPDLKRLFRAPHPGPVIATNRREEEGGRWGGTEVDRLRLLESAMAQGVDFLDVELAADPHWRREIQSRLGKTRLILSWHDFSGTPDTESLEGIFQQMLGQEAQVLKLVTMALKPEDNLRLLALIPKARAVGKEIIAFCMGAAGKWSRLVAPLLGSYLTFAPFTRKGASAPGQLTVIEMKRLWKMAK